jgi:hypothetical protein
MNDPDTTSATRQEPADAAMAAIDGWLNLMLRLSRLPAPEARDIRDELEEHLEQRSRDLMLEGHSEATAARLAIAELGDAAVVASRFRNAAHPLRRRRIMNVIIGGLAVSGVALGLVAVTQDPMPRLGEAAIYAPAATIQKTGPMVPAMNLHEERLSEVLALIDKGISQDVIVDWPSLTEAEIFEDSPVNLAVSKPTALATVMARLSAAAPGIDWRLTDDMVEISTQRMFDLRETSLSSFDITSVVSHVRSYENATYEKAVESIVHLILENVEPNSWRDNGGDIAHLHVVGGRMFVHAPARYNEPIEWILAQLRPEPGRAAGRDFELERLSLARDSAKMAFDRSKALYERGLLRSDELNVAETAYKTAEFDVEAHRSARAGGALSGPVTRADVAADPDPASAR